MEDDTLGMTEEDAATEDGYTGGAEEPMRDRWNWRLRSCQITRGQWWSRREGRAGLSQSAVMTKSDRGESGGTREPGGARWQMVSGGAKGKRSQGGANVSTGRVGALGTEAGGGTRGLSGLGGAGALKMPGRSLKRVGDAEGLKDTSGGGTEGLPV